MREFKDKVKFDNFYEGIGKFMREYHDMLFKFRVLLTVWNSPSPDQTFTRILINELSESQLISVIKKSTLEIVENTEHKELFVKACKCLQRLSEWRNSIIHEPWTSENKNTDINENYKIKRFGDMTGKSMDAVIYKADLEKVIYKLNRATIIIALANQIKFGEDLSDRDIKSLEQLAQDLPSIPR